MKELSIYPVIHQQTVAWGDMDAFGHVNNVQYYRYIESARIKYLTALDVFAQNVVTVVASSQCKYLSSVVYPDTLHIGARIEELRNSAFRMQYSLWSEQQNKLIATAEAVMVCIDKTHAGKVSIPAEIKQRIIELELRAGHNLDDTHSS